jgi:hypothetical protein
VTDPADLDVADDDDEAEVRAYLAALRAPSRATLRMLLDEPET